MYNLIVVGMQIYVFRLTLVSFCVSSMATIKIIHIVTSRPNLWLKISVSAIHSHALTPMMRSTEIKKMYMFIGFFV